MCYWGTNKVLLYLQVRQTWESECERREQAARIEINTVNKQLDKFDCDK